MYKSDLINLFLKIVIIATLFGSSIEIYRTIIKVERVPHFYSDIEYEPVEVFDNTINEKIKEEVVEILPPKYQIRLPNHYYQTFNNCGPATLSMVLNYYGQGTNQKELGNILRPYQHPQGNNDDKSVSLFELAGQAEKYGYQTNFLPNGDIEKIKKFIYKDIPVITVTWLNDYEDIGHYRIIKGYNDDKKVLIQDDSYQGPNREYKYDTFLSLWQPFNYQYLIIYEKPKQSVVEKILGNEVDKNVAWENSLKRSMDEELETNVFYPIFNQSSAYYYLGEYEKSIETYEEIESKLPFRMLWYQYEPILSYYEMGEYEKALSLTTKIINNNNLAYSEMYLIRGDIYLARGDTRKAELEYEKALKYNKNLERAKEKIRQLE